MYVFFINKNKRYKRKKIDKWMFAKFVNFVIKVIAVYEL